MKKLLALSLFLSLSIISGCSQPAKETSVPPKAATEKVQPKADTKGVPPMVGNDRDSHGCIGSAGYSWCEAKQKCLRVWEEPCAAPQSGVSLPDGYSLDNYKVEEVLKDSCKQDEDCSTPGRYLVRSNAPYVSLCLKGKCTVVSPSYAPVQTTSHTASTSSIEYNNSEYGFSLLLPLSWKGYSIVLDDWSGNLPDGKSVKGPKVIIRHPAWTADKPYQDIPVMVFTAGQWKLVLQEKLSVGAAPIAPSELGHNLKYVFALPARYNFAFPNGFEEVEKIIAGQPLRAY